MKSNNIDRQSHILLAEGKQDESWVRYYAGWPDIKDRYDVTVALVRGQDVLDIGCAECLLGHLLIERGHKGYIAGVDISKTALERAMKKLNGEAVNLFEHNMEYSPIFENSFDTVVLGQVLEHVIDVQATIDNSLLALRKGGRVIVNVPADDKEPHGNHLHVFESLDELLGMFSGVDWEGRGRVHRFFFAWGTKQ